MALAGILSQPRFDPDALDYFSRIATAGSSISANNQKAVDAFVKGCKADGIWNAIKASCLLAGPDTLAGALVPLVGPAPTNFSFAAADYNRTTGLKGDGSTKYLDSNRLATADVFTNRHFASYSTVAETGTATEGFIGSGSNDALRAQSIATQKRSRIADTEGAFTVQGIANGLFGASRSASSQKTTRYGGTNYASVVTANASLIAAAVNIAVFSESLSTSRGSMRLSFYSIGESLDLAALDARITTYMASIQ